MIKSQLPWTIKGVVCLIEVKREDELAALNRFSLALPRQRTGLCNNVVSFSWTC